MGIAILYACNFPHRTFLILGVVPVKAYILIGFYVLMDVLGFVQPNRNDGIAHADHLGGAAFAGAYFYLEWHLGSLVPAGILQRFKLLSRKFRGVPLRAHRPPEDFEDLSERADALLEKIHRKGIDSLTAAEKQLLEEHARRLQERRR
jgi:hypothetical protein